MKKWKLYLGLLIVFLAGIVVGSGGTLLIAVREVKRLVALGPAAGPEIAMRRLDRVLDLTPEQKTAVEPIVMDAYHQLLDLRSESQPRRHAIIMAAVEQMKAELTPDQQTALDQEVERARHHLGPAASPPATADPSPEPTGTLNTENTEGELGSEK